MKKAFNSVFKVGKMNSMNSKNTSSDESDANESGSNPIITECNSDSESSNTPTSSESNLNMKSNNNDRHSDVYTRQQSSSVANKVAQLRQQISGSRKASLEHGENHLMEISTSPKVTSPADSDDETPKFEKRIISMSPRDRFLTDNFKAEKSEQSNQEMKVITSADSSFAENRYMSAMKSKMESNGFSASKLMAASEDQRQMTFGDTVQIQKSSSKAASMTMSKESNVVSSTAGKTSFQQQKHISQGIMTKETNVTTGSFSKFISSANFDNLLESISPKMLTFSSKVDNDLEELWSIAKTVKTPIISKTESIKMKDPINNLEKRMHDLCKQLVQNREDVDAILVMTDMLRKVWSVPKCGWDVGFTLSNIIRTTNALESILLNLEANEDWKLTFASAQLIEQCLIFENRNHIAEHGLENVISVANQCVNRKQGEEKNFEETRVGTGILEHLFKHSEETCNEVIKHDGLKTILQESRSTDTITLRHCASALANLSLYGGRDSQEAMIKLKAEVWLFPLAFHKDDNIKYYACLAITVLVANKELEAAVLASGTLGLVEPFVLTHNPETFAKSSTSHIHGQSKLWLCRLVPVLMSKREEARSLAAFHFAMEAWIKKTQDQTMVFKEINAIEPLKIVASRPNAIASKYAAQALRLIGEKVPHKLSHQVALWTIEDVKEWVKHIDFAPYCDRFEKSKVDGDLLLQLDDQMLAEDVGIQNRLLRKRFFRELDELKQMSDYSSCDVSKLYTILSTLGPELTKYTYSMIKAGVNCNTLPLLSDEMLLHDCNVVNIVHRMRILEQIHSQNFIVPGRDLGKDYEMFDAFISYRRSNGSHLASLLKSWLQASGFSVFLDVKELEAGAFGQNLLKSIQKSKNFVLVLTEKALDRCINDTELKDWVHMEIIEAIKCKCNIIPIMTSDFQFPKDPSILPSDISVLPSINGISWVHDYQEACIEKLQRFMQAGCLSWDSKHSGGSGDGKVTTPGIGSRAPVYHGLPPAHNSHFRSPSQPRF